MRADVCALRAGVVRSGSLTRSTWPSPPTIARRSPRDRSRGTGSPRNRSGMTTSTAGSRVIVKTVTLHGRGVSGGSNSTSRPAIRSGQHRRSSKFPDFSAGTWGLGAPAADGDRGEVRHDPSARHAVHSMARPRRHPLARAQIPVASRRPAGRGRGGCCSSRREALVDSRGDCRVRATWVSRSGQRGSRSTTPSTRRRPASTSRSRTLPRSSTPCSRARPARKHRWTRSRTPGLCRRRERACARRGDAHAGRRGDRQTLEPLPSSAECPKITSEDMADIADVAILES